MRVGFREIMQRFVTYPFLLPLILAYELRNDDRLLDMFYSIRSLPHGMPMSKGLVLARYRGETVVFPTREDPAFDDVFLRNVYYEYQPSEEDIVFDVGAHMGFFVVKIADRVKRVVAIEPDPYNLRFLNANVEYNGLANVTVLDCALSDEDSSSVLDLSYGHGRTRINKTAKGLTVKVWKLDSIAKQLGIYPNVVKIDVEGDELKVLKGAESTLINYNPRLIIASYHYNNEYKEIADYLTNMGYRCLLYVVPLVLQKTREEYIYAFSEKS